MLAWQKGKGKREKGDIRQQDNMKVIHAVGKGISYRDITFKLPNLCIIYQL